MTVINDIAVEIIERELKLNFNCVRQIKKQEIKS